MIIAVMQKGDKMEHTELNCAVYEMIIAVKRKGKPMGDYIERQAAIDRLQSLGYEDWNQGVMTSWADAFLECADIIGELPAADVVERKTGTPCDLCRHNPPSSGDGKPCSYCPAE